MPMLAERFEAVRTSVPLVHNITNYVTVHDVANVIIACGGSPIMSDEPDDVEDITSICGALNINIGTLNSQSIRAMVLASARAEQLGHPIVLDPVGAGASKLRTSTASTLLAQRKISAGTSTTRGVDVAADDVVTTSNLDEMVRFVRQFSAASGSIVAASGVIDLVSDAEHTYVISNGHRLMGQITGSGCMLSGVVGAYIAANPDNMLEAVASAFCMYGLAGKFAADRALEEGVGNATYSNYLIDEVFKMTADKVEQGAIYDLL